MPHHREGIQEQLDKAYDEGHRDNEAFDEAKVELSEIIARLKDAGYLDTSFEGKEIHKLAIRSLSKEEALAEYKKSGGMKKWVWDELGKNMPYANPNAENLDVMIMNFKKDIGSDEALAEMDKLGVRPITYEELIQYGIAHPLHQKNRAIVGLGSKHSLGSGVPYAPFLDVYDETFNLDADPWGRGWLDGFRFPVVCK